MADDRMPLSLDLLWFLAHAPEPVTLAEIVSSTGHSRTTVDRTLARLCEAGWVLQTGRPKRFAPSMRTALLGIAVLRANRLRDLALRYARELAQAARTSVGVSFYADGEVVYTDHLEARGEHFVQEILGFNMIATKWVAGNILLAYQPDDEIERVARCAPPELMPPGLTDPHAFITELRACRERGYALRTHEELQTGGLAVAVLDQAGRPAFALSLTLLLPVDEATVSRLVPVARTVAFRASTELQNSPYRGHLIA